MILFLWDVIGVTAGLYRGGAAMRNKNREFRAAGAGLLDTLTAEIPPSPTKNHLRPDIVSVTMTKVSSPTR
jgi:hypothetical protein